MVPAIVPMCPAAPRHGEYLTHHTVRREKRQSVESWASQDGRRCWGPMRSVADVRNERDRSLRHESAHDAWYGRTARGPVAGPGAVQPETVRYTTGPGLDDAELAANPFVGLEGRVQVLLRESGVHHVADPCLVTCDHRVHDWQCKDSLLV